MRNIGSTMVLVGAFLGLAVPALCQAPPSARRGDHVDIYHGVRVADPYRWMEEMDSKETRPWVRAQDRYAREFVTAVPARDALRERLAAIADVTRESVPLKRGEGLFFVQGDGSFSRRTLMYATANMSPRQLIDPTAGSDSLLLRRFVPSDDGRLVTYGVTSGASRWERWRVREVATGADLPDELIGLNGAASSVAWHPDGSGFFYERLEVPPQGAELTQQLGAQRVFFHRLGTDQSDDRLVFDPGDESLAVATSVTTDGRFLVLSVGESGSPNNRILIRGIGDNDGPFLPLIAEADAAYSVAGNHGSQFYIYTTADAPRGRVIAVDAHHPERSSWREIIPESAETIDSWVGVRAVGNHFVVGYRKDAWLAVKVFTTDGRHMYDLELPKVGSIWSFVGREDDPVAYYSLSGFADPGTVYQLDVRTGASAVFRSPTLAYDPDDFVTRQVFYTSTDGTRVPMFVTHHRDVRLDGENPTFMYGYGAFNWAASPWFQPQVAAWLQLGGVYAMPNIRGGGEYGEEWHRAGIRRNKQQSIDDYLAAADWLIANGYTSKNLLVANGGSASGPLVGAAITQRPDLFAASVIDFPALDMLRLEAFTGGRGWRSDFGTVEDKQDFHALHAYSPYHAVREGTCYPATIISPGERDESTVPMHAYKFAAALQHAQSCDKPILLRVSWGAGHSHGATLDDSMDTWADQLAFLVNVLGLDAPLVGLR